VHERSNGAVHGRLVEIRVVENNCRCLAAQLEENRLDMLASGGSNDRTDQGATGEVDLADIRVGDQRIGYGGCVGVLVIDDIEDARRKTSLAEDVTESPEALGRELGALEDDGITRRDGESDGTSAKDERSVPAFN
jgi:hypothetical protein